MYRSRHFATVPGDVQIDILNVLWLQGKELRYACLCEAEASHSRRMWAEASSSAPHVHSGLSDSPVRHPVFTLKFLESVTLLLV